MSSHKTDSKSVLDLPENRKNQPSILIEIKSEIEKRFTREPLVTLAWRYKNGGERGIRIKTHAEVWQNAAYHLFSL